MVQKVDGLTLRQMQAIVGIFTFLFLRFFYIPVIVIKIIIKIKTVMSLRYFILKPPKLIMLYSLKNVSLF